MAEDKEIKVPSKENLDNVKDDNPKTWLNENLWKKFWFKLLAYLVYSATTSIVVVPVLGWSMFAFVISVKTIVLPLVWSALDAQARNRENQQRLQAEERSAAEKAEWEKTKEAQDTELATLKDLVVEQKIQLATTVTELKEVKGQLDLKCQEMYANQQALIAASIKAEEVE